MTQPERTVLIQNARAGDSQAQEALIREIQDRVYYHCMKMIKNEGDALDAAQDVLITVLTSLDKLREPAAFYRWVNGITADRCKHMLAQGGRERQIPEDGDGNSILDELEGLDQQAVPDALSPAQRASLTASVLSAVQAGNPGSAGSGTATGGTAAGGTAAKAGLTLGAKIMIGILAAAAAAGAVFGALQLTKSGEPEEPALPVQAEEPLPEQPEPPEEEEPATESPEPPEDEGPSPELLALLNGIVYYGDPSRCKLTPEQAAAFAEVLRQETSDLLARSGRNISRIGTCAALFDAGDGTPTLFFGGGLLSDWADPDSSDVVWSDVGAANIWQYQDGQAVPYAPEGQEPGGYWGQQLVLRDGSLFIGGAQGSDGSEYGGGVYPLTGAVLPTAPQTSAGYAPIDLFTPENIIYQVDGAEATEAEFEAWRSLWEQQEVLCGHYWDGGVGGSFTGLGDAAAMEEALMRYASGGVLADPEAADPAYAPVYAQKVRALLLSGPDSCQFDLIEIDGDDVPELLVSYPEPGDFFLRVDLYTANGSELCTLCEGLTAGLRGSGMYYYPGQNAVRLDTAGLQDNQWTDLTVYYQVSGSRRLEQMDAAPAVSGDALPLEGSKTGDAILNLLEP